MLIAVFLTNVKLFHDIILLFTKNQSQQSHKVNLIQHKVNLIQHKVNLIQYQVNKLMLNEINLRLNQITLY
jgi:hypothetical protein